MRQAFSRLTSIGCTFVGQSTIIIKLNLSKKASSEVGGFKEVIFGVHGEDMYGRLKFEGGVHRVQRIPSTESQGPSIHTSTVTVAVLPEA